MEDLGFLIRVILIFSPLLAAYCLLYLAIRRRRAERLAGSRGFRARIFSTAYLLLAIIIALGPLAFLANLLRHASDISVR